MSESDSLRTDRPISPLLLCFVGFLGMAQKVGSRISYILDAEPKENMMGFAKCAKKNTKKTHFWIDSVLAGSAVRVRGRVRGRGGGGVENRIDFYDFYDLCKC